MTSDFRMQSDDWKKNERKKTAKLPRKARQLGLRKNTSEENAILVIQMDLILLIQTYCEFSIQLFFPSEKRK